VVARVVRPRILVLGGGQSNTISSCCHPVAPMQVVGWEIEPAIPSASATLSRLVPRGGHWGGNPHANRTTAAKTRKPAARKPASRGVSPQAMGRCIPGLQGPLEASCPGGWSLGHGRIRPSLCRSGAKVTPEALIGPSMAGVDHRTAKLGRRVGGGRFSGGGCVGAFPQLPSQAYI
jgi:hypothetical protein